ncbi:MAG: hypothetical protein KAS30_04095, partial [Candidatus Diapherotrites archaeon]|nr:hypothetical protein [Candidatus Diapherotrites archaeon]
MSHHDLHLIHSFFHQKEINHIYISVFLMTFSEALISLFVPIYFFKLGFPIPSIIFFYFLVSFFFLTFSLIGAKIVSKIGIKHSILLSTPFLILYYFGLRFITDLNFLFFVLPAFLALRMVFYNYGFHLNYLEHCDNTHKGKELSIMGISATTATILAPFIAGITILFFNFEGLFLLGSALLFIATVPLFFMKETYEKTDLNLKRLCSKAIDKSHMPKILSFSGYAIESQINRTIWPIFLITILLNTESVGFIVTISFILSISAFYLIGKLTDTHNKTKILQIGTGFYFFAWIARLFVNSPFTILLADSYKNLSSKIVQIPWSAKSYDMAAKENYFDF